ncbi:hypothetical protein U9M48_008035 [Paspalum notatum var. saurae]|uniref:Uncharacterized protein n=1 Tax=Paspalum notatum var. saurae TaxID=547442 RepID=A0AAQ3WCS2_PASNO
MDPLRCHCATDDGVPSTSVVGLQPATSVVAISFPRRLARSVASTHNARVIVNPNGEINGSITGPIG